MLPKQSDVIRILGERGLRSGDVQRRGEILLAEPPLPRVEGGEDRQAELHRRAPVEERGANFSAGERQLLAFARALVHDPAILILDEPTRGIDVGAKVEIHRLLRNLAGQGIGVIMISSELPEIIGTHTGGYGHHGTVL